VVVVRLPDVTNVKMHLAYHLICRHFLIMVSRMPRYLEQPLKGQYSLFVLRSHFQHFADVEVCVHLLLFVLTVLSCISHLLKRSDSACVV